MLKTKSKRYGLPEMKRNLQAHKTKSFVKEYLLISLFYALFTLTAFWPAFTNITATIPGAEGDAFYYLWNMWWANYATFNLHMNPYFNSMLFYPLGVNMAAWSLPFFESFMTYPIQLLSLPAAYNFVVFIGFVLSGVFTYALVKYLVKDKYAAFIGGMIYAFSPIHIGHTFAGHLNWASVEFLPLLVLCLLLLLKEQKYKYSFFTAITLLFVTFFGDFEQSVLAVIIILVLLYFYLFLYGFRKTLTKKLVLSLLLIPLFTVLLGLPIFSQALYSFTRGGVLTTFYKSINIGDEIVWSNSLLGFFIPSYYNQIYNPIVGGGASNFLGPLYTLMYNRDVVFNNTQIVMQDERTSYIGFFTFFLFLCGIYCYLKGKKYTNMALWLSIFLFFWMMSLGPLVRISNNISFSIPGPFLIYTLIPVLDIIREAGRFYFAATIPLAIIVSVGVLALYKKLDFNKNKQKLLATALISMLLFLDYFGIILPGHTQLLFLNATVPDAYQTIQAQQQNVSVLLLPSFGTSDYYQEEQMYYQTLFKKPLFDGFEGKVNITLIEHTRLMPISAYEYAFETNTTPTYQSPVRENITLLTDTLLVSNNVGYVGVIKKAYTQSGIRQLTRYLSSLLGDPIYDDNATEIFSTNSLQSKSYELAYYPSGTWLEGNLLCSYDANINCTDSFSKGWWGLPQRNITILSPSSAIVNISFSIKSFNHSGINTFALYLNSAISPLSEFSIPPNQTAMRFRLQLSQGVNQLEFYMPSISSTDNFLTYDLHNFSIEK